ncbi:MAG: flagellar motor protein MotB [Deltaproteobacteria bacterium]|nr:flagellar motor protein MotB [Deltaproteobacteria bacterium]
MSDEMLSAGETSGETGKTLPPPEKPPRADGDGPDPDAWMVTFSDLLTLLMTFFVLIFASQSPQKEKLSEISTPREGPFGAFRSSITKELAFVPNRQISQDNIQVLLNEIGASDVTVTQDKQGMVIGLPSETTFEPGSDKITPLGLKHVLKLGEMLRESTHDIRVEGHTDPFEADPSVFKDPWFLSLARAQTVQKLLFSKGVPPDRTSIIGFGPSHPRFDNTTSMGRTRNRRVEIKIMRQDEAP